MDGALQGPDPIEGKFRVLDLFSGLGGWSSGFQDHVVHTLDLSRKFLPHYCMDILTVDRISGYDVILASPPCQCFSKAAFSQHYFTKRGSVYCPNNAKAVKAVSIARHTFKLLTESDSTYWFIENPQGLMRKVIGRPTTTVWYCQYGADIAKPTDIWTNAAIHWRPVCFNSNPDCHHIKSSRGSRMGTEGIMYRSGMSNVYGSAELRSVVPIGLSSFICKALEKHPPTVRSIVNTYK